MIDRSEDNLKYVMCPGSLSCLCPYNMTGAPNEGPKCVKLEVAKKMCPVRNKKLTRDRIIDVRFLLREVTSHQ